MLLSNFVASQKIHARLTEYVIPVPFAPGIPTMVLYLEAIRESDCGPSALF
jgi:hypothetical protein